MRSHRLALTFVMLAAASTRPAWAQRPAPADPEMACLQTCSVPDTLGGKKMDPNCVKRCLTGGGAQQGEQANPAGKTADCKSIGRFSEIWDATPAYAAQKKTLQCLLASIGSPLLDSALTIVRLEHGTGGDPIGIHVSLGTLTFESSFFSTDVAVQKNLAMFELGKAVWLYADSRRRAPAADRLLNVVTSNAPTLRMLKYASLNGRDLVFVFDPEDSSSLGYAFRVLALDLQLPPAAAGVDARDLKDARDRWSAIRAGVRSSVQALLER